MCIFIKSILGLLSKPLRKASRIIILSGYFFARLSAWTALSPTGRFFGEISYLVLLVNLSLPTDLG
jgi:hypothetical protein